MALADQQCIPCRGGTPPLTREEIAPLHTQVPDWEVVADHHLSRTFKLRDFAAAVALVDAIAVVAEEQGHHPDLHLSWGKVGVEMWTHKIDGLTSSDFFMAAKIDRLFEARPGGW